MLGLSIDTKPLLAWGPEIPVALLILRGNLLDPSLVLCGVGLGTPLVTEWRFYSLQDLALSSESRSSVPGWARVDLSANQLSLG
jgi:hypothetical protein